MPFAGLERVKSLFPGFQIQKNRAAQPGESSAATVRTIFSWLRPLCPSSKASLALSKGITALIMGRSAPESIKAPISVGLSPVGLDDKEKPTGMMFLASASDGISAHETSIPSRRNVFQERSNVSPPTVSNTILVSLTISSKCWTR